MNLDFATVPDDRRLEIEREFDAPRDLVWRMFADPYHLSRWWGPKGYTNPVCEIDFRVGGAWRNVMRGPNGKEYPVDSVFTEIVPPERIVFRNAATTREVFGNNPPPSFVHVFALDDLGNGRTRLTMTAYFDTAEHRQAVIDRGFRQGTEESFDKLVAHLASLTGGEG